MKSFLAIAVITLASSFSSFAQEHTPRAPVSTPSPAPPRTPTNTSNVIDTSGWVRFTSEPGRFSVLMPEMPNAETPQTTQSEHGPYTTHLFITRTQSTLFLIGWVDYDPNFNFNLLQELEANRDNFVKGINAKLLTTRPTVIDGYSALEFTAETTDRIFKSRVYMVGRRPYQIVIGSPKGQDDAAQATRFFNSFKVRLR